MTVKPHTLNNAYLNFRENICKVVMNIRITFLSISKNHQYVYVNALRKMSINNKKEKKKKNVKKSHKLKNVNNQFLIRGTKFMMNSGLQCVF